LGLVLAALIPVLHVAHATGLRNLLAATIAVWTLILLWRARQWPPLALPVMAWIALGAGSAAWSPDAESTLKSVFYDSVLPFGVMYAAYLASRHLPSSRAICAAVAAGTALLAAFSAFAFLAGQTYLLADEGRTGVLYYYPGPGASSTLSVFALPIALLLATDDEPAARRMGYLSLACILVAGLGSLNRMFLPCAVLVLAGFLFWQWPRLSMRWRVSAVGGILACALAALGVVTTLTATRNSAGMAQDVRFQGWREWGNVALDAPLLGHGMGKKIIRAVGKERLSAPLTAREPQLETHAHNLFLDVVLQVGVAGLAVFCWLLAALVREAWRARSLGRWREGAALAALVVALVTKNLTDDFMDHAVVIAFWGYAGLLLRAATMDACPGRAV
jgi:O-antigen ligase